MRHPSIWASLLLLTACAGTEAEPQPVTRQRPTLSNNTATTATGTVELEAGVTLDPGDAWAVPVVAKWGADERTEVFASWSPWIDIDPGLDGSGDVSIGVRHRLQDESEDDPSFALQLRNKLPTGGDEVSTGEMDLFVAAILGKKLGEVEATAFYQLGFLGDPGGRGLEYGHDLALAGTLPLDDRFGLYGELGAILIPDVDFEALLLNTGATYAAEPSLVFDAGVSIGLSNDAPDLVLLFGVTHNLGLLGKLF